MNKNRIKKKRQFHRHKPKALGKAKRVEEGTKAQGLERGHGAFPGVVIKPNPVMRVVLVEVGMRRG